MNKSREKEEGGRGESEARRKSKMRLWRRGKKFGEEDKEGNESIVPENDHIISEEFTCASLQNKS